MDSWLATVEKGKKLRLPVIVSGWVPTHWDVIDPDDWTYIVQDEPVTAPPGGAVANFYRVDVDTDSGGVAGALEAGKSYALRIKNQAGDGPSSSHTGLLVVTAPVTDWLGRLVSLAGDNLLLDRYDFDDAGNPTSYRVRGFDTRTNAENASPRSFGDPTDAMEPGELYRITVQQSFAAPRSLLSSHLSFLTDLGTGVNE